MDTNRDSAEYEALILHTSELQLAVETQLISLGAELVSVGFITPNEYAYLRNPHHQNDIKAANLIQ